MGTSDIEAIYEQAARWADRLRLENLSPQEQEDFDVWLGADERHAMEFERAAAILTWAECLPEKIKLPLKQALQRDLRRRQVWVSARPFAIAASLLLALAGSWMLLRAWSFPESYATQTGEMRTVAFGDGSTAVLNTQTRLRWAGGMGERRVELLEGEAYFEIKPGAKHPFRVVTDRGEITVLGTQFNVYRQKNGNVALTVLEGRVGVAGNDGLSRPAWQRELQSGEQLTFGLAGPVEDVHSTQVEKVVRWREGTLEVWNEPVSAVLAELTRYTDEKIDIQDPSIAELPVMGFFRVRDVHLALAGIEASQEKIIVDKKNGKLTLRYRTQEELR